MNCGERLKQLRHEAVIDGKSVSQERLARLSGVCINTIAYIETGKTKNAGLQTIETLMEAIGLTLEDFVNE